MLENIKETDNSASNEFKKKIKCQESHSLLPSPKVDISLPSSPVQLNLLPLHNIIPPNNNSVVINSFSSHLLENSISISEIPRK